MALGVISDEVQRSTDAAAREIGAMIAVLQELPQECRGRRTGWARHCRATNLGGRKSAFHGCRGVVVQFVVLFRCAVPI